MSRGDHREPVFLEESDRPMFLSTLGEACAKTDWQVHACCLMNNHFHLVVEKWWKVASHPNILHFKFFLTPLERRG
ncbi:MAG: transposase [Verrucomicrobiota bacterium]|jgi:REP element-mobilizing transposase RayT